MVQSRTRETPPTLEDPDLAPPKIMPQEETRRVVGELIEDKSEQVTELSESEQHLFSSLLTVGQRMKTVDVMGFSVGIQSLRVSDDLRISLWCKTYEDTRGLSRAYQTAVCAAGIRTVNGEPIFRSLTQNVSQEEIFQQKIDQLQDYYPIVISQIYNEIIKLDTEFAELAKKLGKLKG